MDSHSPHTLACGSLSNHCLLVCTPSSVFGSSFSWHFKASQIQYDYTCKDFLKGHIYKSREDMGHSWERTQFNPHHVYLGNPKTFISEIVRISEAVNQPDLNDMYS